MKLDKVVDEILADLRNGVTTMMSIILHSVVRLYKQVQRQGTKRSFVMTAY